MKIVTHYAPAVIKELFNFKSCKVTGIEAREEKVIVHTERAHKTSKCPHCGRKRVKYEEGYERMVRDLDLSDKKCFIVFKERKISCKHGFRGIEALDFVDRYSRYTKRFKDYVSKLCQFMSLSDVARAVEVDWKTVKRIDKNHLSELAAPQSTSPTKLGVDEVSYQKGHKYLTVVHDLDLGKVIWIGIDRKKETLDNFFKELGEGWRKVKVVVLDMWDPYISSVEGNTRADIVFDKFHIAKKVTEALNKVRRQFHEACQSSDVLYSGSNNFR